MALTTRQLPTPDAASVEALAALAEAERSAGISCLPAVQRAEWQLEGQRYSVHECSLADTEGVRWLDRLQRLVPWFVETTSITRPHDTTVLDPTDMAANYHCWVVVAQSSTGPVTVGFCVCRVFFAYPDRNRWRICQFLVLPPYQRQGIGGRFLQFVQEVAAQTEQVVQLTVQGATPAFQMLRDYVDAQRLQREAEVAPYSPSDAAKLASRLKMSKSQVVRVGEILALGTARTGGEDALRHYRLTVKQRLNKRLSGPSARGAEDDDLMDAAASKKDKLAFLYADLEESYEGVLERLGKM
mmetsp:Transcript_71742/g.168918  ORF Transcript_71742/g.168918 Transcript_71742/m.168918 type:complete len:299 (+) Transcript_71742:36-932(+)